MEVCFMLFFNQNHQKKNLESHLLFLVYYLPINQLSSKETLNSFILIFLKYHK